MADEELTERQSMILNLRKANREILARLASQQVQVSGIANERHESFILYLIELGVLTKDQMEHFDVLWESQLNDTLQKQEIEFSKQLAKRRAAAPRLIIPGH